MRGLERAKGVWWPMDCKGGTRGCCKVERVKKGGEGRERCDTEVLGKREIIVVVEALSPE